jgi:hypothetical protein
LPNTPSSLQSLIDPMRRLTFYCACDFRNRNRTVTVRQWQANQVQVVWHGDGCVERVLPAVRS